ncbi:unnamed protein product [Adineta ricciae]|uniref:EB domain-containing protein n=1 Tax=Adineta ricciae TaxID=249248 RepID=A0A814J7P2_ADIRI|nr:unnamed protein product [Adineta ricciae]CAF1034437.1 unnamed protein product [Adineta ricciae]
MWLVLLLLINSLLAKAFPYTCRTNVDCMNILMNSLCHNSKCVCRKGYKWDELFECTIEKRYRRQIDFGIRMLGEECESNDECRRTPVDGAKICLLSQCQCSPGHVPIDAYRCIRDFEQLSSNTRRVKSYDREEPPGYGSICVTNKDCQHSTVQLECLRGSCVCLEGYVPLGKYLCYNIRGGGAPIIESTTIDSLLTTTIPIIDSSADEIVRSLGKLGTTCTNDYYCRQSVTHSHCYNGQCSCIEGYISFDLYTCSQDTNQERTVSSTSYKSLLGGACHTNRNCQTAEAICLNNICTCPNNYFPIDDWNCLSDSDTPNGKVTESKSKTSSTTTTTVATTTTTVFLWWPWSPPSTTRESIIDSKDTFPFRCILHRQCISMDANSHCTSFGKCVCNLGYGLETKDNEQKCVRKLLEIDECD